MSTALFKKNYRMSTACLPHVLLTERHAARHYFEKIPHLNTASGAFPQPFFYFEDYTSIPTALTANGQLLI